VKSSTASDFAWVVASIMAGAVGLGCSGNSGPRVTGGDGGADSTTPDAGPSLLDAGQGPDATTRLDGPEDSAPDDSASSGEGLRDSASTDAEATPREAGVDGALEDAAIWTCPATACTTCGAGENTHNLNNNPWAGSLTLFISYSADTQTQTVNKGYTPAEWNAAVNSFDVSSFATQVRATGAKNILLMLGQNTGYYCSPNSVYETYAGVQPGTRASTRDLPMEIADALAPMGIGMYLYLPEDVGWGDTNAAKNFGLTALAESNWVVDSNFAPKWNAVIKTWADRYGTKVRGWFFDGYEPAWGVTQAMAETYRDTCLAANPCGIVTFNGTNGDPVSDTQRGETAIDTSTGLPAKGLPTSRWDPQGLQTMWDFPLQAAWGQEIADNSPAIYTNANLKEFVAAAVKAQAVFALDCRTSLAGQLSVPIYSQLIAIQQ
jgi:hypothetical protein